jgi:hypothetical protein
VNSPPPPVVSPPVVAPLAVALLTAALLTALPPQAAAQLPALVAKVYPGAVAANTRAGKVVSCNLGEDHHDPYCFVTKDPIAKIREFYARDGIRFDSIPVGKDMNAKGDGVYDLEEAVRLQLDRDAIGSLFAAPVEWWSSRSSADEPAYFNTVVLMSGKQGGSTTIMIQRTRKDGVTRDPAVIAREWRAALRFLQRK